MVLGEGEPEIATGEGGVRWVVEGAHPGCYAFGVGVLGGFFCQ